MGGFTPFNLRHNDNVITLFCILMVLWVHNSVALHLWRRMATGCSVETKERATSRTKTQSLQDGLHTVTHSFFYFLPTKPNKRHLPAESILQRHFVFMGHPTGNGSSAKAAQMEITHT